MGAAREARRRRERELVALPAEAADDPARGPTYEGIVAEFVAPINVGEVHLDDRQGGGVERIEYGDRGVREGAGIEDDAVCGLPRLVNPVDQLAFVVRLAEIHDEVERSGTFEACLLDVRQRLMAVDFRLAQAEQVEVRSVEDQNRWIAGQPAAPPWL